jgi:hypothetical protein
MKDFALIPDEGPPRLIRFMQGPIGALALYDKEKNLLMIDKDEWHMLSETQQHIVLRTHEHVIDDRWSDWPEHRDAAA